MRFRIILQIAVFSFLATYNGVRSEASEKKKGYYIENNKYLTWSESIDFCKNMSMNLFNVRNQDEFDFLKTIITQRYNRVLPYWMGAYRMAGVYRWLPSGDTINHFFWHMGEPNDKSGQENCIHTWDVYFDWNDNDCERSLAFICEFESD